MKDLKYALINTDRVSTVQRYMPSNYDAVALGTFTLVFGSDNRGYTMEDYVLPRMAQWGLYPVFGDVAYVEYRDGVFSLIDAEEPFDMPVDEVWLYTQGSWEAYVNSIPYGQTPEEGFEWFGATTVADEVERRMDGAFVTYVLDPLFDFEAARDYANAKLQAAGLLAEEI